MNNLFHKKKDNKIIPFLGMMGIKEEEEEFKENEEIYKKDEVRIVFNKENNLDDNYLNEIQNMSFTKTPKNFTSKNNDSFSDNKNQSLDLFVNKNKKSIENSNVNDKNSRESNIYTKRSKSHNYYFNEKKSFQERRERPGSSTNRHLKTGISGSDDEKSIASSFSKEDKNFDKDESFNSFDKDDDFLIYSNNKKKKKIALL